MDDCALLELAAKAGGYQVEWVRNSGCYYRCEEEVGREEWNPLDDDGDALRLAVALKMDISFRGEGEDSVVQVNGTIIWICSTLTEGDPMTATREAIVSVAAEIGKAM